MTSTTVEASADEQLICPLCDYDLRGLVDPRCPECGYAFTWDELRDPTRRLHPYLFEHHPERNIWSFRKTLLGSLLPRRFWRTLFPTQPSFPRRLACYGFLVAAVVVVPFCLLVVERVYRMDQAMRAQRALHTRTMTPQFAADLQAQYGSVQAWMDQSMPLFPSPQYFRFRNITGWWDLGGYFQVAAFVLLWPWMTFASLLIFRASMRRARVRPVHVLRCVIYTADAAVVAALLVGAFWYFSDAWFPRTWFWSGVWWSYGSDGAAPIAIGVIFVILTYRLWIAYRRYLRFEHALATAIASQVMIALLTVKLMADLYSASWGR